MARLPGNLSTRAIGRRETLWLIAGFVLASTPHLLRLPLWISGLIVLIVAWRLYRAQVRQLPPAKWILICIAVGATAGVMLHYRTLFGREAGVALLLIMLSLKLLETRTQRDGMLLGFLGCFLLVTNFLYSQTIPTGIYMLGCAWFLIATLITLQYTGQWPGWLHPIKRAGVLLLQALPLMLVLFVLFPRIQGPLWGLPQDAYAGLTGLSDSMSPGSLNNLILSDSVAFRASFQQGIPGPKQLYWRGPVLWDYDGRTWSAPRVAFATGQRLPADAPTVEYTVTLEPHNKRWLFALEFPGLRPPKSLATRDMQLLSITPVRKRLRYDMVSSLQGTYGADDDRPILRRALRLPSGSNPRTMQYAQELRARFTDDRQLVAAVLNRFRTDQFYYTLSPPLLGEQPVDDFLFNTRSGFCEHYASAFVVLMRSAGIPARVVTGYQGGEINPVGEYILVRQADAHAWAEVWFADTGWTRVDPTAAVSPTRVERGIASALPLSDQLPIFVRGDFALLQQMRLAWDSVTYTWNQWVLGYSPERQRLLLTRFGFDDATWRTLAVILMAGAAIAILFGALFALRGLRAQRADAVVAAYHHYCRKLGRRGVARNPAEGPLAYAGRAARHVPAAAAEIADITRRYAALRYGRSSGVAAVHELQRRVRDFSP